jgi:sugar/nucleoside kinase (ribokinase family)
VGRIVLEIWLGTAMAPETDAIVAGHLCLDIIPEMAHLSGDAAALWRPGSLHQIGAALLATGGAVSNTGISLHRLGVRTRLLGKVGDDPMGDIFRDLLKQVDPALGNSFIVSEGESTSYSLVLSPGKNDRLFLHHSGANDTHAADDVPADSRAGARLFHFGYPPNMRRFYSDGGAQLESLFAKTKSQGLTTSLDMVQPDRRGDAGLVDWRALLRRVLPLVDLFMPSLDEICFMLGHNVEQPSASLLEKVATELLDMGCPLVGLRLGDQGLFLRTTTDRARLASAGRAAPRADWAGRSLLAPCFQVNVAGTTGPGDSTIAGFLTAMLNGLSPEQSLTVAVGACCVERPDATSGVPAWDKLQHRLRQPWLRGPIAFPMSEWRHRSELSLWIGPDDPKASQ